MFPYHQRRFMSGFATANIPAGVNTLEKAAAWVNGALYDLHKNSLYKESDLTGLVPRVTCQVGVAADQQEYAVFRVSVPLDANWRTSTSPLFQLAQEIADTPIPNGYLAA